ncbi:uncharacterized protein LOC124254976 [Haliotis rubra]|uniref:uncharacterized protein LOC124254976 n=1 Tax=Haliotis rubra TaxID=36100 RepID=UPI001EE527D1|nr:uncharacterized protein LOC124254976 [Haliotis rubra]
MSTYMVKHASQSTIQGMLAYMEVIRNAAVRFGGDGWSLYDEQFRHRMARDPSRSWAKIDGELWLKYMTPQPSRYQPADRSGRATVPYLGGTRNNACLDFNRSRCTRSECKFQHKCSNCCQSHPANSCFRGKGGQRPPMTATPNLHPTPVRHSTNPSGSR